LLDRPTAKPLDYRAINRKACRHWRVVHAHLVDLHGRIVVGVLRELNPEAAKRHADGQRPRRLEHFTISEADGSWRNLGSGHSGDDIVSLLQFLAHDADRAACAEFLDFLTSRIVEIP
jgi:hypothetical protein